MARLPVDQYTFPWGDAETCPCGTSDKRFVDCCKQQKMLPLIKIPTLLPPGELTGHGHPACYMSSTRNCSSGKSREHYVSEEILDKFQELGVSGMPWQEAGAVQTLPTKALVANILCERHNSALSPIDALGARAFEAFVWAADYAVNQRYSGRAEHFLISGEALELWMYKLMAGIHFGGIAAANGEIIRDKYQFPIHELVEALSTGAIRNNAGLIVTQNVGLVERSRLDIAPIIETEKLIMLGVTVQFGSLLFETTIVPPPIDAAHSARLAPRKRPRIVDFSGPARDARVVLSWKGWTNEVRRIGLQVTPD